jgi:hypothetical protein
MGNSPRENDTRTVATLEASFSHIILVGPISSRYDRLDRAVPEDAGPGQSLSKIYRLESNGQYWFRFGSRQPPFRTCRGLSISPRWTQAPYENVCNIEELGVPLIWMTGGTFSVELGRTVCLV